MHWYEQRSRYYYYDCYTIESPARYLVCYDNVRPHLANQLLTHYQFVLSPNTQARIAVLLGERKGQESLKSDLIRRIKMLEYALNQERAKFHRLKFGCDPPTMNDIKPPTDGDTGSAIIGTDAAPDSEVPFSSVSNTTWRQGRSMLRSYLQEIGYTDTIIDVRSNRVRAMLGLNNNAVGGGGMGGGGEGGVGIMDECPSVNGNDNNNAGAGGAAAAAAAAAVAATKRAASDAGGPAGRRTQAKKALSATVADAEAAVLAALEFLDHTDVGMSESDDDEYGGLEVTDYDNDDVKPLKRKTKVKSEGEMGNLKGRLAQKEVCSSNFIVTDNENMR